MKKNKPMRAAGVLLIATMLTSCMTAGTFAKYTTTDSAADTARVAKFGVNVSVNGSLFGEEYVKEADGNTPAIWTGHYVQGDNTTDVGTVQVYTRGDNVVAPGTKNDTGLGLKIQGQPEVDCEVTVDFEAKNIYLRKGNYAVMETVKFANADEFAAAVAGGNIYSFASGTWTKVTDGTAYDPTNNVYCKLKNEVEETDFTGDYYFPVQYTAKTDGNTAGTVSPATFTSGTAADSLAAVANGLYGLKDGSKTSTPPTATVAGYSKTSFKTYTQQANNSFDADFPEMKLTWKWDFYVDAATDGLDTILGDLVAQDQANYSTLSTDPASKTPFTTPIATKGACRVVKTSDGGTHYAVPAAATSAADADHKIKYLTADGDYNLETAVYFSATVTQID